MRTQKRGDNEAVHPKVLDIRWMSVRHGPEQSVEPTPIGSGAIPLGRMAVYSNYEWDFIFEEMRIRGAIGKRIEICRPQKSILLLE